MFIESFDPGIERRPRRSREELAARREQRRREQKLWDRLDACPPEARSRLRDLLEEPGTNVITALETVLAEFEEN